MVKTFQPNQKLNTWFHQQGWEPLHFQLEAWEAITQGQSGILQAAPGTGKTYAIMGGFCNLALNGHESLTDKSGLRLVWITPLRALASDIASSLQEILDGVGLNWVVGSRTGDTLAKDKAKQAKRLPEVLVTTPESLHLLLTHANFREQFKNLKGIVIDEWHELLGNKRGVQVELALSHLHAVVSSLQVWGLSATIGNIQQALQALCGHFVAEEKQTILVSPFPKKIDIQTLIPSKIERFPWAGHLGLRSLPDLLPLLEKSESTLIFTNTRAQAELWYQHLLELKPDWAEIIGIHHGSLDGMVRKAVEMGIQESKLKVVVCTSSLDLGVDFHPVEQVVQVGSPKGIARCLQRAGRSGHRPYETSTLTLVPTHALELIDAIALKQAVAHGECEPKVPLQLSFDVLIQYLLTLSVGEGFNEKDTFNEIKKTHAFQKMTPEHWQWVLDFLSKGGKALQAYEDYKKVHLEEGLYKISSIRQARKHRLSIGTMMGNTAIPVRFLKGPRLGTIEEDFATRLKPGDLFWYNGKCLKFVYLRDMTVWVRKSAHIKGVVPRWRGGRLPFSSLLSHHLSEEIENLKNPQNPFPEAQALSSLIAVQKKWSIIPNRSQLLIEKLVSKEGHHLFIYPFEGRMIHEALAQLLAYRLSQKKAMTFGMAYNDYGLELLSDQPIPFDPIHDRHLLSLEHVEEDLITCLKKTELVKHHFREVARVAGLIFTGYPGKYVANRHLQMSAELLFNVFEKYDPENYLIKQCYAEVLEQKWDLDHLRRVLEAIKEKEWIMKEIRYPTPFGFPLFVEQWRDRLSSETLKERIEKMSMQLEQVADQKK